jgi:hypothetical protein
MPRMEGNQMHTILTRRPQSGGGKAKAPRRRGDEVDDDNAETRSTQRNGFSAVSGSR